MKKTTILLITVLFMVIGYAAYNATINIYGNALLAENLSDFKVYLSSLKVNGTEVNGINDAKDEFTIDSTLNGSVEYEIKNDSTEYDADAYLECELTKKIAGDEWSFDYTGSEQTFTAPVNGVYTLEVWGAQGGSANDEFHGGYGGYSKGNIELSVDDKLYINVGSTGKNCTTATRCDGGYNGGGSALAYTQTESLAAGGGGATHIATSSGLLSTFVNNKKDLIIVAAGGGGGHYTNGSNGGVGGSAGGYTGMRPTNLLQDYTGVGRLSNPGNQSSAGCNSNGVDCGSFGQGGNSAMTIYHDGAGSGGGSGYYGGSGANIGAGAGGSSYIGNSLLLEKSMYCYNCTESSETSTKTISTTCTSATPTENCPKSGNGYAKISFIESYEWTPVGFSSNKNNIKSSSTLKQKFMNVTGEKLVCSLKIQKVSKENSKEKNEASFIYTGEEEKYSIKETGTYKLEVWGAQGGSATDVYSGGYGGYSIGYVNLNLNDTLYINVGGTGQTATSFNRFVEGGYNGGGSAKNNNRGCRYSLNSSGGGATHIATTSGLLSTLENNKDQILIVAGGGGGGTYCNTVNYGTGGSAGGVKGQDGYNLSAHAVANTYGLGATQTAAGCNNENKLCGSFGLGYDYNFNLSQYSVGGGGGFYGGGGSRISGAGGGSSYIGNSFLSNKAMYCYNCTESTEISTKTISTTCVNSNPTENCAKQGNGYARITLVSID